MEFTGERFIPNCGLENEIEQEHLQRYLSVQNVVSEKKVLDIASGAGYGSALIAERASLVCGVDIDFEAVSFAREHYKKANLEFFQGSLAALPFASGIFDVVVSFETIEHVPEELHKKFLEEIVRVLAPDGFLVISSPDKKIYSELANYKNEFHLKEYYKQEFYNFLKQSFPNVYMFDQLQGLAYILTDNKFESCLNLHGKTSSLNGKYIIAVCSLSEIPETRKMGSVIFDQEGVYQKKINRIIELQEEIVEKNQNIADAWKMIHERDAIIQENWKMIGEKDVVVRKMNQYLEQKEAYATILHKENMEKDSTIMDLHGQLRELQRKIDELSGTLTHIRSTKGWKIIQKMYWLKSKLLPF